MKKTAAKRPVIESIKWFFLAFPNPTKKPITTAKTIFAGIIRKAYKTSNLRSIISNKYKIFQIQIYPNEIITE